MGKKELRKKIREERLAERPQYDDLTRRLKERIERGRAEAQERRASS
jgi:hypothetical protein